jgi:hypothetical protein
MKQHVMEELLINTLRMTLRIVLGTTVQYLHKSR